MREIQETNYVNDLELMIAIENTQHAVETGLIKTKKILQYDKENELIKEWNYIRKAAKVLDIPRISIHFCINGKAASAGGYVWKFS